MELAHSLSAGWLSAVLRVWQLQALQAPEQQLQGQQTGQDHKLLRRRGLQLARAQDAHHKILAVAQTVLVLPGLAQRVAHPPAQVTRQAHHLALQVIAARLHPFGVKIQV